MTVYYCVCPTGLRLTARTACGMYVGVIDTRMEEGKTVGLIIKSLEDQARAYVKQQIKNETSSSPLLNKFDHEGYTKRLQAGETVEALVAEKLALMRLGKTATKRMGTYPR